MKRRPNAHKSRYARFKQRPHTRGECANRRDWSHINLAAPPGGGFAPRRS